MTSKNADIYNGLREAMAQMDSQCIASVTVHPLTARAIIDQTETANINPTFAGLLVCEDPKVPEGCAAWKNAKGEVVAISNSAGKTPRGES